MTIILTSSPSLYMDGTLNPANGFLDEVRKAVPQNARGAFFPTNPENYEACQRAGLGMKHAFEEDGLHWADYTIVDQSNEQHAREIVAQADFVILGGGHLPSQHKFFQRIGMRDILKDFDGTVMGISAGSMNAADIVYLLPEEPGESTSITQKFVPGLGLTQIQIIPHYHLERYMKVDGLRLFEDIAFKDSLGHSFFVFPDGTYIFNNGGREEIRGEAFLIENGVLRRVCSNGQRISFPLTHIYF